MPTDLPSKPPSLLIEIQSPLRSTWGLAQINAAGQLTRIGQACCRLGLRPVGRLLVWLSIWWLDRLEWHGLGIRHEGGLYAELYHRYRPTVHCWMNQYPGYSLALSHSRRGPLSSAALAPAGVRGSSAWSILAIGV
jgi:hypothetical protein